MYLGKIILTNALCRYGDLTEVASIVQSLLEEKVLEDNFDEALVRARLIHTEILFYHKKCNTRQ
jgi:hypothetical protein